MNITSNGNSDPTFFSGGKLTVAIYGTFDTASVSLEANFNGDEWIPIQNDVGETVTFTSESCRNLEIAACNLRAVTSGGGGSLDLNVLFQKIYNDLRNL